jgi:hypothetical protein
MLNLIQHLTKSRAYETLKQVQGDQSGLFTRPSNSWLLIKLGVRVYLIIGYRSSVILLPNACLWRLARTLGRQV